MAIVRPTMKGGARKLGYALRALAIDFGNRDLGLLGVARVGTSFANWSFAIALGVYGFEAHGAVGVGLVALVRFLPGAIASPFAGLLIDRYPRRTVLLASSLAMGAVLAGATVAASLDAALGGRLRLPRPLRGRLLRLRAGRVGADPRPGANPAGALGEQRHPQRDGEQRLPARRDRHRHPARRHLAGVRVRGGDRRHRPGHDRDRGRAAGPPPQLRRGRGRSGGRRPRNRPRPADPGRAPGAAALGRDPDRAAALRGLRRRARRRHGARAAPPRRGQRRLPQCKLGIRGAARRRRAGAAARPRQAGDRDRRRQPRPRPGDDAAGHLAGAGARPTSAGSGSGSASPSSRSRRRR